MDANVNILRHVVCACACVVCTQVGPCSTVRVHLKGSPLNIPWDPRQPAMKYKTSTQRVRYAQSIQLFLWD